MVEHCLIMLNKIFIAGGWLICWWLVESWPSNRRLEIDLWLPSGFVVDT